jgi:diguanylate cyclase (GGDEF)-like protein
MPIKKLESESFGSGRDDMGSGDGLGGAPNAARLRDASADRRDLAALERDIEANVRDGAALAADLAERPSSHLPAGRAWERRSARERQLSAADRVGASMDREKAAEDRVATREHIAHEATDALTGTMRREAGLAAIAGELDRSTRADDGLVVAFVGTIGLKAINDSRGHAAGDRVLQDIAECLSGYRGEGDFVVRIGGGGFVCSLSRQTLDQADLRYVQVLARLAGRSNGARVSVGLTARQAGDSLEILVDRADQVMLGHTFNGRLGASPPADSA